MEPVVIAVCSADPLILPGVRHLLDGENDLTVVPAGGRLSEAQVALVVTEEVDAAALQLLGRIARSSLVRVVLVVNQLNEADLPALVRCRVVRILARRAVSARTLVETILAAVRCAPLPGEGVARLMDQLEQVSRGLLMPRSGAAAVLAPRERDLLMLLAEGLDTTEVAERLAYSERTVKNIVHGLLNRLELRNRAHAVAFAMRSGAL